MVCSYSIEFEPYHNLEFCKEGEVLSLAEILPSFLAIKRMDKEWFLKACLSSFQEGMLSYN